MDYDSSIFLIQPFSQFPELPKKNSLIHSILLFIATVQRATVKQNQVFFFSLKSRNWTRDNHTWNQSHYPTEPTWLIENSFYYLCIYPYFQFIENGADGAVKTQHSKTFLYSIFQEVRVLSAPLPHFVLLLFSLFFAFNQFYILYLISILNFKKFIYILWLYMVIMTK